MLLISQLWLIHVSEDLWFSLEAVEQFNSKDMMCVTSILCGRDVEDKFCLDKSATYPSVLGGLAAATKASDPLSALAKQLGGSKRNALLKWCQNRTANYTVSRSN